jgi:hypothetical protein
MRIKMLGLLVAASAFFPLTGAAADSVQIGPFTATCDNQCVVVRDSNGNVVGVQDCCGGRVRMMVVIAPNDP